MERVVVVAGVVVSPLGVVVAVITIIWHGGEGRGGGLHCIGGSIIIVGGAVWWWWCHHHHVVVVGVQVRVPTQTRPVRILISKRNKKRKHTS